VIERAIPNIEITPTTPVIVGSTYTSALIADSDSTASASTEKLAIDNGVAYADLTGCLLKLRQQLKIPDNVKLTVSYITTDSSINLQNIANGNSLGPSIKVAVYRSDNNSKVDTSLCTNAGVNVKTPLREKKGVNMNRYRTLKEDGIDALNPNHPAFNDRCFVYSDTQSGVDTTINSRRKYYYQGFSVQCNINGGKCDYNEINLNNYIDCDCMDADPKNDVSSSLVPVSLPELDDINIDVIGCLGTAFVRNTLNRSELKAQGILAYGYQWVLLSFVSSSCVYL
jgi:hypothetical protein